MQSGDEKRTHNKHVKIVLKADRTKKKIYCGIKLIEIPALAVKINLCVYIITKCKKKTLCSSDGVVQSFIHPNHSMLCCCFNFVEVKRKKGKKRNNPLAF